MDFFVLVCLLGHFISLPTTLGLPYECPEPESIYPCYCEDEDENPWVFCNNLLKPEEIYNGVKGIDGYRIHKLSFYKSVITEPVKRDAFKGLEIERILLLNSTINLESPQFEGLSSLKGIQIRGCYNNSDDIISLELDHLKNLEEITFEKNSIDTLPNSWLKSAPESLKTVTVERNLIVSMEDEVFSKIKKLTFLILESNRIVTVKRSMLPKPAYDLKGLNLNKNQIRYLPSDTFSEMPSLRILEVAGNRLTTLDERIWSGIFREVTKLDLSDNPFVCDRNLKWLYTDGKFPIIFDGRCEEPARLRRRSLNLLKLPDLD